MSKRQRLMQPADGLPQGSLTKHEVIQRLLHTGGISNDGLGRLLTVISSVYDGIDLPSSHGSIASISAARSGHLVSG